MKNHLISISEAKKLVEENVSILAAHTKPVPEALGYILAEDILSPINLPPFPQSTMDGYGIRLADLNRQPLRLKGMIRAGDSWNAELQEGDTLKILTGAYVPASVDAVVMQEKVRKEQAGIFIEVATVAQGENISKTGAQVQEGQPALSAGTLLTPATIGFLAAMGMESVRVYRKPRVAVLVTGNELQQPGEPLWPAHVYDANSATLYAALRQCGLEQIGIQHVQDDPELLHRQFQQSSRDTDIVLISGGISVGDYDFTGTVLERNEVQQLFYKVKQKPGKPLYFGKMDNTLVFGLPGNPASLLVCFYQYIYPAIRKMTGHERLFLPAHKAALHMPWKKPAGLGVFLKGKLSGEQVMPLEGQASYMLKSFAIADCLIYLPEGREAFEKGEEVEVHLLPAAGIMY